MTVALIAWCVGSFLIAPMVGRALRGGGRRAEVARSRAGQMDLA